MKVNTAARRLAQGIYLPGKELWRVLGWGGVVYLLLLPGGIQAQSPASAAAHTSKTGKVPPGMVRIPEGWIDMGSRDGDPDEQPLHRVYLKAFYIDRCEATVAEYREFCAATGRSLPAQPAWNSDLHPVVNVDWEDANAFAEWRGKRLPTEAEWEYAARCGERGFSYAWGDSLPAGNIADETAKRTHPHWEIWEGYDDGFLNAAPVGSFAPNLFGVYDMTGNVWEWCADWYDAAYYRSSPFYNPRGPKTGEKRVVRGGSWSNKPAMIRAANRVKLSPDYSDTNIGFRCVRDE